MRRSELTSEVAAALARLEAAIEAAPQHVLGVHPTDNGEVELRVFRPGLRDLRLSGGDWLSRIEHSDLFVWRGPADRLQRAYSLQFRDDTGNQWQTCDPYHFDARLPEYDLHLFGQGRHWHAWKWLGAHATSIDGIAGVRFAVWAPNARNVSLVGEFNGWDGRCHPMIPQDEIWVLFVPGLAAGDRYKFEVHGADGSVVLKADPWARAQEFRPATASRVAAPSSYVWRDQAWTEARRKRDWRVSPMSVYEVQLGSWRRWPDQGWYGYRELAHQLVDYVGELGFTHIELMPITEYPFDGSWGYQPLGLYAPTSRFGSPEDFRYFVDHCHDNGIGVLMDWVPAHFPKDAHGLARFDGTPLFEHPDPRRAEHPDWGTLVYDYGRTQVRNFLLANALYWIEEFHIDGLRVDAVSSMIQLDYSRKAGEWTPNEHGGNEHLEAIDFLRELNTVVHGRFPGVVVIAEEATAWPQVSRPVELGGLGFSMKWNMGWMHDTLDYFEQEPVHRKAHHDKLTFGITYAWDENFVLPLSHDEVVHGKSPLLYKMPGDEWQQFANLRALLAYQWTYPGKKLLFMGGEFGVTLEWNEERELDWNLLRFPGHAGVQRLLSDLNRLYRASPPLWRDDFSPSGFEWVDCNDRDRSIINFLRHDHGHGRSLLIVCNFTPVPREGYRIGVPVAGRWRERINSDSSMYGGSNLGNVGEVETEAVECMGRKFSLNLALPPLSVLILEPPGTSRS